MDPRPRRILSTACVAVLALTSACSWGGSDDSAPADQVEALRQAGVQVQLV